ncbi:Root primordium defective [Thalictrum thalictroides]|uniref:Root primordium defective n=1 Tax=Thalictrum thalictroides TaxID=46969 RepID=A0A7J6WVU4_THATH|nr:Root primordium defective [Thalictrum thalictroides]
MICRYPTIFQVFRIPSSSSSSSYKEQVCIGLTPQASTLFAQELSLKATISSTLANKLQKLLMLSSHKRLLLDKLVHLATDLGLPPNFRSRLCNDYPERFKTVQTSYGRALELVSWDHKLAIPLPSSPNAQSPPDLIVDRPLKFKYLRLRKGLNLKRKHREFLISFGELPQVNPYCEDIGEVAYAPESIQAEKRACALVREVLGMMVEKKTLVDHLTHFRKDFNLSNKVRGMLVRHPELFYVSMKGQRDSVFLVEGYDDKGKLLEKDELLLAKERLVELVREGKKIRREIRRNGDNVSNDVDEDSDGDYEYDDDSEDEDGFENLFEEDDWEDYTVEDDDAEVLGGETDERFWTVEAASSVNADSASVSLEHW